MTEKSVSKSTKEQELIEKVSPVLENLSYHLRDIEVTSGRSALIRVTIDRYPETEQGHISIDDCSQVHRVVGPMFDVWDPLPGAYSLEISSPGEKPKLRLLSHFQAALGE